jgi:hypothetical protein
MINHWFFIGLAASIAARFVGGQVISIVAGLAAGIIVFETVRWLIWWASRL